MKQKISKLVSMVRKEWMFNTNVYAFELVEGEDYPVVLKTNKRDFEFGCDAEIRFFIEACLPVDQEDSGQAKQVAIPTEQNDLFLKLSEVLLDNIEKVQDDEAYIRQASVISKQVQTMINLTNMKMNIIKASK